MRLTAVHLRHFRNLVSADFDTPPTGVVLVGPNGHGKTNFLEAIHYLARFRSFRLTRHADAIAFGGDHFRVEGEVRRRDDRSLRVSVAADRKVRKVTVDGQPVAKPLEAVGEVLAVLLAPGDLALVAGSPGERRRYLDALLGTVDRGYARALQGYERALRQRNELLRAWPPVDGAELETWNRAVVSAGVPLVMSRLKVADRLAARFREIGARIAGSDEGEAYELEYRPAIGGASADAETLAEIWGQALEAEIDRDRRQGWTTSGPHRDDLLLMLGGRRLARFGSQGEQRTGAIALRVLEIEFLEAESGETPILLLDDVFSELDEARAERLLEWLGDRHQRFVTTPRPLPRLAGGLEQWSVHEGRITPRLAAA